MVERAATLVIRQALGAQATATGAPIDPVYAAESNAPKLLALAGTFCGLATLFVFMRFYCRVIMIKSPGMDDYMMVLGLVRPLTRICYVHAALTLSVFRYLLSSTWGASSAKNHMGWESTSAQ